MNYRNLLAMAFRTWTKDDCEIYIEFAKHDKTFKMASNMAKYILSKKYSQ